MILYISKIESAASEIVYSYFDSEHVWGILNTSTYRFVVNDVTGQDGDVIQEGAEALESAYARPNIAAKIGIDEYRNGNVTSINFDEYKGVDKVYGSIVIEERLKVEDDENLSELTNLIPSPQDVLSFSESLTCNRGEGKYSYQRNVNLAYKQDTAGDFINKAYLFLKNIYLNQRPDLGYMEDGISENAKFNSGFKPQLTEKIDILNKSVSLTESLNVDRVVSNFSKNEIKTISLSNGYINTSYDINLKSLTEPLELNLASGIKQTVDEILSAHSESPFVIQKGINDQSDTASLLIQFSNDPRKSNVTNIDYSVKEGESNEGFLTYSFDLQISSKGPNNQNQFSLNKDYWLDNIHLPYLKIPAMFNVTSGDLNEVDRTTNFDPFGNSISETVNFSTDNKYDDNGDGILYRKVNISDKKPTNRTYPIPIYGDTELVIRKSNNYTLGEYSVNTELTANYSDNLDHDALEFASGFEPNASNYYLLVQSTTLNPLKNVASAILTYNYFDE